MSKEARVQSEAMARKAHETNSTKSSMQRYLQYLKSDTEPVSEEEQYALKAHLKTWHENYSS